MNSTTIKLPASVPFPVTVTSILMRNGENIPKHKTVLKYKYWDYEDGPDSGVPPNIYLPPPPKKRVERIGSFECPIVGEITNINIRLGQEIEHSGIEIFQIREPCSHSVQYGGLCALCGKPLDEIDYSGYNFDDRAPISMSHGTAGLKVSLDEAEKIEQGSTDRLLNDKKLILVVDLDQTVIHATVDPTVGEWKKDPSNPNYQSVKDVQSFSLEEEIILPQGYAGVRPPPQLCWYYVKLRPGLQSFLEHVAELYELHIYTMATRSYAINIAKIIDPTGKFFGDRILSRDESGSLTQKSLKRLFPVDQSMVVVIDDRGDVWNWSSNLIKVVPYDFFVGIGDINSSFLPRQKALLGPSKTRKSVEELEESQFKTADDIEDTRGDERVIKEGEQKEEESSENEGSESNDSEKENKATDNEANDNGNEDDTDANSNSPVDRILALAGGEDNTSILAAQASERNASIEAQQIERPLAKLQKDLEKIIESKEEAGSSEDRNLLYDDDTELQSLEVALKNVHNEFYKLHELSTSLMPIESIMPSMKSKVLKGVTILFSGVLALGTRLDSADIVIWARSFGATVVPEVYDNVTHVICRNPGTFKVRIAKTLLPDVKIVNPDWLFQCIKYWERVDEENYIINASSETKVNPTEVEKYKRSIMAFNTVVPVTARSVSVDEGFDWGEANQEVEDFLNSGSSDEDDDEDDDEGGAKESGDDSSEDTSKKRSRDESDETEESKRSRLSEEQQQQQQQEEDIDLDELEKELMLGFEDLEGEDD